MSGTGSGVPIIPASIYAGAGYNLATYRNRFLQVLEQRSELRSSPAFTDAMILSRVNEAILEICTRNKLLQKVSSVAANALSISAFLPSDILNGEIYALSITDANGVLIAKPDRITARSMFDRQSLGLTPGVPLYWCTGMEAGRVSYYPALSTSALIKYQYLARPNVLSRMVWNEAFTANATAGSGTVTATMAGYVTGSIAPGDEIGFVTSAQIDGSTIDGLREVPVQWSMVKSITSDGGNSYTITLESAYEGVTVAGAMFVTAQASIVEQVIHGVLENLPGELAAGLHLQTTEPSLYQSVMASIQERLALYAIPQPGVLSGSWKPSLNTNFLR